MRKCFLDRKWSNNSYFLLKLVLESIRTQKEARWMLQKNKLPGHYWQRQGKVKTWKWRHTGRVDPRLGPYAQNLVPADKCTVALGF